MFSGDYAQDFDTWSEFYDSSGEVAAIGQEDLGDVLEVGVGSGRLMRRLAPHAESYTAMDVDPRLTSYVVDSDTDVDVVTGDGQRLPFKDERFDTVVDGWTFSQYSRPKQAAREYSRVVAPGGEVCVLREDDGSEYERILQRFVSETESYDPSVVVDETLESVFGTAADRETITTTYDFPTQEDAFEAFRFHLEEWGGRTLSADQRDELYSLVAPDADGVTRIGESVQFLRFQL